MRRAFAALLLALSVLTALTLALPRGAAEAAAPACTGVSLTDIADRACGLALTPGAHVVRWTHPSTPVAEAFAGERLAFIGPPPRRGAQPLEFVSVWQREGNAWRGWSGQRVLGAEPLPALQQGATYYVVSEANLAWSIGPLGRPSLFAEARIVSLYGRPGVPQMGALGVYPSAAGASKAAAELAARYAPFSGGRRVVPALHVIVDAAQIDPGADGTHLGRLPLETIAPYVEATRAAGQLLFLDLQVGLSDPRVDMRRLAPLLAEPHVHLALDPEFATAGKADPPGEAIGSLTAAQVNAVQRALADLVRGKAVPPKVLVVHQFRYDMLPDAEAIERVERVYLVIDMDGYGTIQQKLEGYLAFARAPYATYAGFKLFYDHDTPVLTPEQVMRMAYPPDYVIYQ